MADADLRRLWAMCQANDHIFCHSVLTLKQRAIYIRMYLQCVLIRKIALTRSCSAQPLRLANKCCASYCPLLAQDCEAFQFWSDFV